MFFGRESIGQVWSSVAFGRFFSFWQILLILAELLLVDNGLLLANYWWIDGSNGQLWPGLLTSRGFCFRWI
jgi:hypothetical protein